MTNGQEAMPAAIKSVLILGDERKGHVKTLVERVLVWLKERAIAVDVEMDRDTPLVDRRADLVVVFGGDGSLLAAARRMGSNQLPTLGVNLGRLGFLTAFDSDHAFEALEVALAGGLTEEPRLMLECSIERHANASRPTPPNVLVLNDAVLSRRAVAGIVTVAASRPDRQLATYSGDGVIVATPVGSTAYSLAAGGPVISPRLDAVVITPLAPHSLTLRPLVIPAGGGLFLEIHDTGGAGCCPLTLDGQVDLEVELGDRVWLRPAPAPFRHLTRGPASFFTVLREKFGWADQPRREPRDS